MAATIDTMTYNLVRDGLLSMRSTLMTASRDASASENWAHQFSKGLVRLLQHTHVILTEHDKLRKL